MWPFKNKTEAEILKETKQQVKDIVARAQEEALGIAKKPVTFMEKIKAKWEKHADSGKGKFLMVAGGVSAIVVSTAAVVATGGIAAAPLIFGGVGFMCSGTSFAGTLLDKKHDDNKFSKDLSIMMRDNFKVMELIQKAPNLTAEQKNEYVQLCTQNHLQLEDQLLSTLKKQNGIDVKDQSDSNFRKVTKVAGKTSLACTATMAASKVSAFTSAASSALHIGGAIVGGAGTIVGIASNSMRKVTHQREVRKWAPQRNEIAHKIGKAMTEVGLEPSQKVAKWSGLVVEKKPVKAIELEVKDATPAPASIEPVRERASSIKKAVSASSIGGLATAAASFMLDSEIMDGLILMDMVTGAAPEVMALGGMGLAVAATAAVSPIINKIIESRGPKEEQSWVDRVTRERSKATSLRPDNTPPIVRENSQIIRSIVILAVAFTAGLKINIS